MRPRWPVSFTASIATHALAAVALWLLAQHRAGHPAAPTARAPGIDLEIVAPAPPAPSRVTAPPAPVPAALARALPAPARRENSTRAATPATPATPESSAESAGEIVPAETPGATESPPTETTVVATAPPGPAPSAADLFRSLAAMDPNAARAAGLDLGTPGAGRPSRDLFGRPRHGSAEEQAREAASAPVLAALEGANHMRAAGSTEHGSRVSRRAEESFDPVHTVAGLGAAVMRAPSITLPPPDHRPSGGELAAADGMSAAHGANFNMVTMLGGSPPITYHLLRADVEVDQDTAGAITSARVVRRSGVTSFDQAALRTIRQAVPDAGASPRGARRSRWSFEVSDAASTLTTLRGGGNDGWRPIPDPSNGVQLRMRVRMIDSRALREPPGEGLRPRVTGSSSS